jgi:hypothetical protein
MAIDLDLPLETAAVAAPPPLPAAARAGGRTARLRGRLTLLGHPGGLAGHLEGRAYRRWWAAAWTAGRLPAATVRAAALGAEVVAFSCERDVPEQAASIRSFLRFAGRPLRFVVASDGTHTPASRARLEALDPCVEVRGWREAGGAAAPTALRRCAERHALGKKLALIAGRPIERPTIFADSDVLFLPGARDLDLDVAAAGGPRFQLDCFTVLDERLVAPAERRLPTNTGFLILPGPLDWERAAARLAERLEDPAFFRDGSAWAEQGVTHLALRDSGGRPLDPSRYVIRGDDYLRYGDRGATAEAVMRHYAGPTRYMMWLQVRRSEARERRRA